MVTNHAASGVLTSSVDRDCQPGDDHCWSKIGVSGDRTCPELQSFVHCRNCPVFAAAARTFLTARLLKGIWRTGRAGFLARLIAIRTKAKAKTIDDMLRLMRRSQVS